MAKAREAKKPAGRAGWAVATAVIIVMLGLGAGWWAFGMNRISPSAISPTLTPNNSISVSQPPTTVTPGPTAQPVMAYGVVTSSQLNLRTEASTTSNTLGTLNRGDIVPLVRRSGGWYQTAGGGWLSALHMGVRQTRLEAESYAREIKTA